MNSPVCVRIALVAALTAVPMTAAAEGQADRRNDMPVSQWKTNYNVSDMLESLPSTAAGQDGWENNRYGNGAYDPAYKKEQEQRDQIPYKERYRDAYQYQLNEFGPNN